MALLSKLIEKRDLRNFTGGLVSFRIGVKLPPNLDDFRTIDIAMVPIVCFFPKNSFLVRVFNEKINILKSAGIFDFLWSLRMEHPLSNGTQDGHKVMTLEMLLGAFEVLLTGLILAFIVFLFEWLKINR